MEPNKDIPNLSDGEPGPQIIRPGGAAAPSPPQSTVPSSVPLPPVKPAASPASSIPPTPNPPQPPQSPPVNTSQLFQPDSKLPEVNSPQLGGPVIVDNRPPKGLKRIFSNKKLTLLLGAQLAVIILVLGGVFGYYLPNRPGAVWKTGLDRSGEALDQLITQATDKKQLEALKKSEINASLDIKTPSGDFSGSLSSRFDESKTDGNLKVSIKEASGQAQTLGVKFLSEMAKGATYPDFYLQFSGIKALGGDEFVPGIGQYDGKWILVDAKTLEAYGAIPPEKQGDDKNEITSGDVSDLARTVSSLNKEYIMSSDTSKSIIQQKSFVGKQKVDGISAYHYTAGINKENAKNFCQVFADRITSTSLYKKLLEGDKNVDAGLFFFKPDEKDDAIKDCQKSMDETKDTDTFDIWIDGKYKLIHKIRFTDEKDAQSYAEIGQTYKGGDDVSLFVAFHNGKENLDTKLTFETNVKTTNSKGTFSITGGKGDNKYEGTASFAIKPLNGDINIEEPKDAIPLQEILKKFGYDTPAASTAPDDTFFGGQQGKAKDADRKSDINALYAQVEVYFAENAYYPTLAQINDSSWRSTNLRGLSDDALKPPDGSSAALATTASAGQYGYSPSGCGSQGCTGFVLTAVLANGQKFTKTGSNN